MYRRFNVSFLSLSLDGRFGYYVDEMRRDTQELFVLKPR